MNPAITDKDLKIKAVIKSKSKLNIEQVVSNYSNLVYGCSYRILNNHQSAQDVTQAVFVLFSQKYKTLSKSNKVGGWLYRTATFMAKDLKKKELRRLNRETQAVNKEQETDRTWLNIAPIIDEQIQLLPKNQKEVIRLKYLEGRSQEEIAENMGVARGTVSSWISRGIEKLRLNLKSKGFTVSVVVLSSFMSSRLHAQVPSTLNGVISSQIDAPGVKVQEILSSYSQTAISTQIKIMAFVGLFSAAAFLGFYQIQNDNAETQLTAFEEETSKVEKAVLASDKGLANSESVHNEIASIKPLVLGTHGNFAVKGKIMDMKPSPSGQHIVVLNGLWTSAYEVYPKNVLISILDSASGKVLKEIPIKAEYITSSFHFLEKNKLIFGIEDERDPNIEDFWERADSTHKVVVVDLLSGKKTVEMINYARGGKHLGLSKRNKKLFVTGNYDLFKMSTGELDVNTTEVLIEYLREKDEYMKKFLDKWDSLPDEDKQKYFAYVSKKAGRKITTLEDVISLGQEEEAKYAERELAWKRSKLRESVSEKNNDLLIFNPYKGELVGVIEDIFKEKKERGISYTKVGPIGIFDDESKLLVISGNTINEYDCGTNKLLNNYVFDNEAGKTLSNLPAGEKIIQLDKHEFLIGKYVFNLDTKEITKAFPSNDILVNQQQDTLYCKTDKKLLCYSLAGKQLQFEVKFQGRSETMCFNPDQTEILIARMSRIERYNIETREILNSDKDGFTSSPTDALFSKFGELVIKEKGKIHIYDSQNGTKMNTQSINKWINLLIGGDLSQALCVSSDGISISDFINGEKVKNFGAKVKSRHLGTISEKNSLIASSEEDKTVFYDYRTGEELASFNSDCNAIGDNGIAYLANGNGVEPGAYDPRTGEKLYSFKLKDGSIPEEVPDLIINEKANLVYLDWIISDRGTPGIWNLDTGECIKVFEKDKKPYAQVIETCEVLRIMDNGKYLITNKGLYDIEEEKLIRTIKDNEISGNIFGTTTHNGISSQFSDDLKSLLFINKHIITIKNVLTGKVKKSFKIDYPGIENELIKKMSWDKNKLVLLTTGSKALLFNLPQN